ncbi:hypothetical protein BDA96_03G214300 [Sorghum bicolor]|uniref:Uncharacterized protein n=1 Tax=Sorghum bicolor TaxID=4558 RepID=A0A921UP65_SORBI|nr:hypothetical protein BDA96_03G214300 [Sorghum bicolor]
MDHTTSEECGSAEAPMEQVVRDVVPGVLRRLRPHGVLRRGLVVDQLASDGRVHLLAPQLADVVEHAAGSQHHGEVLQLHLGALLQARPPCLEPRERLHRHSPELPDLLVERVLRPRQVGVRVRHQHPVHERVAGATHQPRLVHHPGRRPLVEHRLLQHLVVGHGSRPADAHVREGSVGPHHALERDGVGRLLVPLRVPPVEVGRHRDLGRDDGDVGGVHGADDAWHARASLEALLEPRRRGLVGPLQEARHEHGLDGGAHLQDQLVAGGDAEAEALGHEAERLPRGEAPDADGDALADGDGGAEHGVLLGHRRAQRVADHVERLPPHPEGEVVVVCCCCWWCSAPCAWRPAVGWGSHIHTRLLPILRAATPHATQRNATQAEAELKLKLRRRPGRVDRSPPVLVVAGGCASKAGRQAGSGGMGSRV